MEEEKTAGNVKEKEKNSQGAGDERSWAFDIAAIIMAIIAAVLLYTGLVRDRWEFLLVCTLAAVASMLFLVWPEIHRRRKKGNGPDSADLGKLGELVGNIEEVRREHEQARASYDRARDAWETGARELAAGMENALNRLQAGEDVQNQLIQLRQEAGEWSRHLDDWHTKLVDHVDFLDRGLGMDNVDESIRNMIGRIRAELIKTLDSLGVREIKPGRGDEFDRKLHRAEGTEDAGDLDPGSVSSVIQTGFVSGRKVIRPSIVRLTSDRNEN